ncbi:MAG: hypothetical protein ABI430_03130 [Candidatus Taylorbacteria bacterium]
MNIPVVLFIGRSSLKNFAEELDKDKYFQVLLLSIPSALTFVQGNGESVSFAIFQMVENPCVELDRNETLEGYKTGIVLKKKLEPLCPNATFIIFNNGRGEMNEFGNDPKVVPLGNPRVYSQAELCALIEELSRRKDKTPSASSPPPVNPALAETEMSPPAPPETVPGKIRPLMHEVEIHPSMCGDPPTCSECGHVAVKKNGFWKCLNCGESVDAC